MLVEIKEKFNESILKKFINIYEIDFKTVEFIGGFDSFVYSYKKDQKDFILKITHSIRRTSAYIKGELDWLNYMAEAGVSVAKAVPSTARNFIETIGTDDDYFMCICYERAPGSPPTEDDWNLALFEEWGSITGKLHTCTKLYANDHGNKTRNHWFQEDYLNIDKYIPEDQKDFRKISKELIEKLKGIPKNVDNYGLIHGDLHFLNFHISKGKITLFDFDDIGFNYFINDLAVILFYAYWRPLKPHEDDQVFIKEFLQSFLKGYEKHNQFNREWFGYLQDFLKLRHIIQYIAFIQSVNLNNLSIDEQEYMDFQKMIIEKGYPIIDFDFTKVDI
ncbi:phosphotransferase enzyme family protein [Cytobacillus sp. FJAT-54145]|uniref:Phosphotransferase enzyme family protein n=1 Tax=Cytobacillus spartinae TaxID=3299023 RepID=A0ABW6KEV8_9BACI